MSQIKFGTDGWRAVIADAFTFANLDRVSQAAANYWISHPVASRDRKAVIGYDRRFLSDQFARRVAEIFAGNQFAVVLASSPLPTPAVSLAVERQAAAGGIMITASHNPAIFNGFKLKAWYGGSADPEMCRGVESYLDQKPVRSLPLGDALEAKTISVQNLKTAHYRAVKKRVDFNRIAESGLRVAHDALFGVGAGCFEDLLAGTTCQVTTLNGAHDPAFGGINPEPIAQNYAKTAAYLRDHPHDICLVTDGDADRIGGMDGRGAYLTTHQLICLLLQHLVKNRQASGRVVKAITTTSMVDKICKTYGLELVETPVGFKYICAELLKGGVLLGFEESGGIAFPGYIPERDGLLAGLALLEMLATERVSLNVLLQRLEKEFGAFAYARIDSSFPVEKRAALVESCRRSPPAALLGSPVCRIQSEDGFKFTAEDGSWLMLRGSGTEPILRIYAEGSSSAVADKLLKMGLKLRDAVK